MFLLAASPTPGTSGAVPGAMANPSGSGPMSHICAHVCAGVLWALSATSEGMILALGSRSWVLGAQQLPDLINVFPEPVCIQPGT